MASTSPDILPHLFRSEYRKIVSVLCKHFGFNQIETAEDIASDTFVTAAQVWALKGIPPLPVAWLYNVAKNKARNHLQRNSVFDHKVAPGIRMNESVSYQNEIDLSPENIIDSQLQMMFAICHPSISPEAQIGLSLRILCGFGIGEIADAFLTNKETINKRLFRAKEKLREEKIRIEFPGPHALDERLQNVLTTLYLLFNEGYYSESKDQPLHKELCFEAIRLCYMLTGHQNTNQAQVNALLALMCFHASRFEARISKNGDLILYDDQDVELWDHNLIAQGAYYLKCATVGNQVSKYHIEATIAYWNTQKEDTREKWDNILQLYNRLLQVEYSPVAALNRTYALSRARSKTEAITELEKIKLPGNHFYFVLLAELYTDIDNKKALEALQQAFLLAKTQTDKKVIREKINKLELLL